MRTYRVDQKDYEGKESLGVTSSSGVNNSVYCKKCEGISRCILCYDLEGAKLMLFNKPVTEVRFSEAKNALNTFANEWYPNFTNAEELRAKSDGQKWEATPADRITGRSDTEAYADIPAKLKAYIKSLPEFDAEIYKAITGRE